MAVLNEASWLHRLLRITPGSAPGWFCSRRRKRAQDALVAIPAVVCIATTATITKLFLAIELIHRDETATVAIVVFVVLLAAQTLTFDSPFRNCEWLARDRLVAGQCGRCGEPVTRPPAAYGCAACAAR